MHVCLQISLILGLLILASLHWISMLALSHPERQSGSDIMSWHVMNTLYHNEMEEPSVKEKDESSPTLSGINHNTLSVVLSREVGSECKSLSIENAATRADSV